MGIELNDNLKIVVMVASLVSYQVDVYKQRFKKDTVRGSAWRKFQPHYYTFGQKGSPWRFAGRCEIMLSHPHNI